MKWDLQPSLKLPTAQDAKAFKTIPEPHHKTTPIPFLRRRDEPTGACAGRKLLLVVDRPVIREGYALVLQEAGFAIVGEAQNSREALAHPKLSQAEAVIVDLLPGGEDTLGFIRTLRERQIRSVLCSVEGHPAQIRAALAAGANAYVTLSDELQHLFDAVCAVAAGRAYVSPRTGAGFARKVVGLEDAPPEETLSGQQWRIYQLLAKGVSSDDIASRIHVSPHTVESYCYRIIEKLKVSGMKSLRRRAIIHGMLTCL